MVSILGTLFKYKEKESPDVLGYFPERVHVDAFPERKYLWTSRLLVIVACLNICFNMVLASIIYLLLPQQNVLPRLFKINNELVQLEEMQQDEIYFPASSLIPEKYVRDYITLRYTVTPDYDELEDRWRKNSIFYWYSSDSVYEAFVNREANVIKKQFQTLGFERYVDIIWTKQVTRSLWMVLFKTYDITKNSKKPKVDLWRATMRVGYDSNLRFKDGKDKILNPYGFLIYSYTLSYQGDAHRGQDIVDENVKYNLMM